MKFKEILLIIILVLPIITFFTLFGYMAYLGFTSPTQYEVNGCYKEFIIKCEEKGGILGIENAIILSKCDSTTFCMLIDEERDEYFNPCECEK